jgi:hypothetical protein
MLNAVLCSRLIELMKKHAWIIISPRYSRIDFFGSVVFLNRKT